jgi:hypothetical protein
MSKVGFEQNPKLKFYQLYLDKKFKEAYKLKYETIPCRIFRFQPFELKRLRTLESNELFLSHAIEFDDPFDSAGIFWDTDKLQNILHKKNKTKEKEEINQFIVGMIDNIRNDVTTICFSETLFNLPLWATYAGQNKGFAVEYNFKNLAADENLTRFLYPVLYEPYKISAREALNWLFENPGEKNYPLVPVLFFHQFIKHESWAYQNEWRLINLKGAQTIKLPFTPTAIYAGVRSTEWAKKRLRNISKQIGCDFVELKVGGYNDERFVYETIPARKNA